MPSLESLISGVIGAVVVAIPIAGAWIIKIMSQRTSSKRSNRIDAINEWKDFADRLQLRADVQEKHIFDLQTQHTECIKREADLAGEVKMIQNNLRRLQAFAGDLAPATVMPTVVTATIEGTILSVMGGFAALLHYEKAADLVGKNIKVMVPERYHAAHDAGVKRIIETGIFPDPEVAVLGYAKLRDGSEVPVKIHLSGWVSPTSDKKFINAEIIRRYDDSQMGQKP